MLGFKSSIQRELDGFFRAATKSDFNIREVTKSAFSQARQKLAPETFMRLNQIAVDGFYQNEDFKVWGGYRLVAVDGSRLVLPNHQSVKDEYGVHNLGPNSDSPRSMATISILYDVLNLITLDAKIAPYSDSESNLLVQHLPNTQEGDLLLLDRGYPSYWLLFLLTAKKIQFCVRLKSTWWNQVRNFTQSDEKERIVTFHLPKKDRKKLDGYPELQDAEITCRLIKVILPDGSIEVLCTSLLDDKSFPYESFPVLYHLRWGIEEAYKLLKTRIEIEDFSGKTAIAVKQDFFAKILLMTLSAVYAYPVEERVREEYKAGQKRKYDQKINRTNSIAANLSISIALFIRREFERALNAFDEIVYNTRELIRPNRNNKRKKRIKPPYPMNNKGLGRCLN